MITPKKLKALRSKQGRSEIPKANYDLFMIRLKYLDKGGD